MIDFSGVTMPIQSDDMKIISERLDWHGLNYYFPAKIADDPNGDGARTTGVTSTAQRRIWAGALTRRSCATS